MKLIKTPELGLFDKKTSERVKQMVDAEEVTEIEIEMHLIDMQNIDRTIFGQQEHSKIVNDYLDKRAIEVKCLIRALTSKADRWRIE